MVHAAQAALLLSLVVVGGLLAAPARIQPKPSDKTTELSSADKEFPEALSTVSEGAGPSKGGGFACNTTGGEAVSCWANANSVTESSNVETADPSWTNLSISLSRNSVSMAYDVSDGYVLLFGGYGGAGYLGDTWKFQGGAWTQISTTGSPSPRYYASMAYDVSDGYVLLFGGYGSAGYLGDTWEFHAGAWTQISTSTSLPPRSGASMAYDVADGYVLLFGGIGGTLLDSIFLGDTWKFQAGGWTQLSITSSPSPREYASMDYDVADNYVLLYGGITSTYAVLGETWEFHAGTWTQLAPSTSPSPRSGASMVYDAADSYVLLFGGGGSSGVLADSWEFQAGSWIQLSPPNSPPPRSGASVAYDEADGYVLLYGGEGSAVVLEGDTWKFGSVVTGTFDFSLAWSPSSASVAPGSSASTSLTALLTLGTAVDVSCSITVPSATGLAITALSFSITPGAPAGAEVETVSTTAATPPSSTGYFFYVSCSGGGATKSANFVLTVTAPLLQATTTSVSCSPSSVDVGRFATCSVTVTGSSPSGNVPLSSSSSTGAFAPSTATCTLSAGACSVTYVDTASSSLTAVISASYPGDGNNSPSSGIFSLSVYKSARTVRVGTTSTIVENGGAVANQGSVTGISVTITESTSADGTPVGITTQDLSSPTATIGTPNLVGPAYFDVSVTGISTGSARVCISFISASSSTNMQYWDGTAWASASSITVNSSTVCGTIPVSALTATNIALGSPVQAPSPPADYTVVYVGAGVAVIVVLAGAFLALLGKRGSTRATT